MLLDMCIRPALEGLDFQITRVDQIYEDGRIDEQILNFLREADLAIADLTGLNPNVMYEVGFRHSIEQPMIRMAEEGTSLPFDLATYRTIFFRLRNPALIQKAISDVRNAVMQIRFAEDATHLGPKQANSVIDEELEAVVPRETLGFIQDRLSHLEGTIERAFGGRKFSVLGGAFVSFSEGGATIACDWGDRGGYYEIVQQLMIENLELEARDFVLVPTRGGITVMLDDGWTPVLRAKFQELLLKFHGIEIVS